MILDKENMDNAIDNFYRQIIKMFLVGIGNFCTRPNLIMVSQRQTKFIFNPIFFAIKISSTMTNTKTSNSGN